MSRVDVDTATAQTGAVSTPDGRSSRWDHHRASRRDELTEASRRAIHKGGPDLSMDELAAAIGTSKSIVYRYFTDKTGLQGAVGEAVLRDLSAALRQATREARSPEAVLRAMVGVYLEMVSHSPSVYRFVTRNGDAGREATEPMRTLAQDAAALVEPVLADALAERGGSRDLAPVWAAGVIGFVRGAAEAWLATPAEDRHYAHLEALADAITGWLCAGTGQPADLSGHVP